MYHSHTFRLLVSCLLTGAAAVCLFGSSGPAGPPEKTAPVPSVYHPDPEHLWNRLYEALFVRVGPDGGTYGHDRFEPLLLWHILHAFVIRDKAECV